MESHKITSIPITDFAGKPLPNRFFHSEAGADCLAIIFPGLNYSADMPLLFYTALMLRQRGADLFQLQADYTSHAYQSLPAEERFAWVAADARAALQGGQSQGGYAKLVLVGKSIGTLALVALLGSDIAKNALAIWLTPLLRQPRLVEAAMRYTNPALLVSGSADPLYDAAALQRIQESTGAEGLVVEGANHSLEIPGDIFASLRAMESYLNALAAFLDRHGINPA